MVRFERGLGAAVGAGVGEVSMGDGGGAEGWGGRHAGAGNSAAELLDVIDDKTRALQRWNAELDAKVAQRTAALEARTRELAKRDQAMAQDIEAQEKEIVRQFGHERLAGGDAHGLLVQVGLKAMSYGA